MLWHAPFHEPILLVKLLMTLKDLGANALRTANERGWPCEINVELMALHVMRFHNELREKPALTKELL